MKRRKRREKNQQTGLSSVFLLSKRANNTLIQQQQQHRGYDSVPALISISFIHCRHFAHSYDKCQNKFQWWKTHRKQSIRTNVNKKLSLIDKNNAKSSD